MANKLHGGRNLFGKKIQESDEITLVTEATTLVSGQNYVEVTPPSASTYILSLPPVGTAPWELFYIISTSNDTGDVDVRDTTGIASYTSDDLTTTNDFVLVLNVAGLKYIELKETTT